MQDTIMYYHQHSDTLDNDMTIKEMYLFYIYAAGARSHWHNEMRYTCILQFLHFSGRTYKLDKTWKSKLAVGNDNHIWQAQWCVCKYYSPTTGHLAINKIIATCNCSHLQMVYTKKTQMIKVSHVPIPKRVDEKHRDIYITSVDISLSLVKFCTTAL
jgi:hypothetical protein